MNEKRSIEWAAGLFEGEGCLTRALNKSRDGWSLKIKMTDPDVLAMFHEAINFRGRLGKFGKSPSSKPHHKPHQTWETANRDTIFEVINLLYPYMGERRRLKMDDFKLWYHALKD